MTRSRDTADTQDNNGGAVPPFVAGKNVVLNGAMDIWQRGTTTTTTGYQTADRWYGGAGSTTVSQDTSIVANTQFQFATRGTSTGTNITPYWLYAVETADAVRLAGQTVTLSHFAATSTSQTVLLRLDYSTSADPGIGSGSYITLSAVSGGSISTNSTSLTRGSATYSIPSNAKSLRIVINGNGAGFNNGGWIAFTGVQLEVGSVATPFSRAGGTIQGELAACQRYYYRQNGFGGATNALAYIGVNSTTAQAVVQVFFPTEMRVAPYSLDGLNLGWYVFRTGGNYAGTATLGVAQQKATIVYISTSGGMTVNDSGIMNQQSSGTAYIGFNAEL